MNDIQEIDNALDTIIKLMLDGKLDDMETKEYIRMGEELQAERRMLTQK